jgi:hypothetical protein
MDLATLAASISSFRIAPRIPLSYREPWIEAAYGHATSETERAWVQYIEKMHELYGGGREWDPKIPGHSSDVLSRRILHEKIMRDIDEELTPKAYCDMFGKIAFPYKNELVRSYSKPTYRDDLLSDIDGTEKAFWPALADVGLLAPKKEFMSMRTHEEEQFLLENQLLIRPAKAAEDWYSNLRSAMEEAARETIAQGDALITAEAHLDTIPSYSPRFHKRYLRRREERHVRGEQTRFVQELRQLVALRGGALMHYRMLSDGTLAQYTAYANRTLERVQKILQGDIKAMAGKEIYLLMTCEDYALRFPGSKNHREHIIASYLRFGPLATTEAIAEIHNWATVQKPGMDYFAEKALHDILQGTAALIAQGRQPQFSYTPQYTTYRDTGECGCEGGTTNVGSYCYVTCPSCGGSGKSQSSAYVPEKFEVSAL